MTEQVQDQPAPQEAPTIKPEDIKTLGELAALLNQTEGSLIEWAKKKIADTNYVQAVQTELAMHKGDAHGFMIRCLIGFLHAQEQRITALENLLAKAVGAAKKGK